MSNNKRYIQATVGIFLGLSLASASFWWYVAWFLVGWLFFPVQKKGE